MPGYQACGSESAEPESVFSNLSLTGLLPASPARKGGVQGSYNEMSLFLTGKPRAEARGGFTFSFAAHKKAITIGRVNP